MKSFSSHLAEKTEIQHIPLEKINAIFYMVIVITVFNFIGLLAFLDICYLVYEKVAGIGLGVNILEKPEY
jgi:hypothetical protein